MEQEKKNQMQLSFTLVYLYIMKCLLPSFERKKKFFFHLTID